MNTLVTQLSWELFVLARAIAFPNLSVAASNIGVSQPQLSRIVARLESELGVSLLDRASRRKSGWTPIARRVSETFLRSTRTLEAELQSLVDASNPLHLTVGALEGLIPLASGFCQQIFDQLKIPTVELNVYDLDELEEHFLKGDLSVVFTIREPGHRKFRFNRLLGQQKLEELKRPGQYQVFSSFEFSANGPKSRQPNLGAQTARTLVSNSLAVRQGWIQRFGGTGTLPGEVRPKKSVASTPGELSVYLLGSDLLPEKIWKNLSALKL